MEHKTIKLTKGKTTLVDTADFEWLSQWRWYYNGRYAIRKIWLKNGRWRTIYMHREILLHHGYNMTNLETDHCNRDKLDNQSVNLRAATHAQNQRNCDKRITNSSGYQGVCWHKQCQKWRAQITINGKDKYLGVFDNVLDAAHAYDEAAIKYHGVFSSVNLKKNTYSPESGGVTPQGVSVS